MFGRFTNQLTCLPLSYSFHTSSLTKAASPGLKVNLAKLRKKTGYSLSVCKKALEESSQDVTQAEAWLKSQAQAHGWAKAQKLEGRNTTQGLLGVQLGADRAAMVELKCETDFVARNGNFVSLLQVVAATCLEQKPLGSDGQVKLGRDQMDGMVKLGRDQMDGMVTMDGKTLADVVALNIGQIGENIVLGGGTVVQVGPGVRLAGLTHPSANDQVEREKLQYGRYAAIMAYSGSEEGGVARQMCQHIIGMAPTAVNNEEDKENSLVHQKFLLDETVTVGELCKAEGIEVHSFVRMEVGQSEQ